MCGEGGEVLSSEGNIILMPSFIDIVTPHLFPLTLLDIDAPEAPHPPALVTLHLPNEGICLPLLERALSVFLPNGRHKQTPVRLNKAICALAGLVMACQCLCSV